MSETREETCASAFDAYWETGPDDDPADYEAMTWMARDAFGAGWDAACSAKMAELSAAGYVRNLRNDPVGVTIGKVEYLVDGAR